MRKPSRREWRLTSLYTDRLGSIHVRYVRYHLRKDGSYVLRRRGCASDGELLGTFAPEEFLRALRPLLKFTRIKRCRAS